MEVKCQIAIQKLKSIFDYTKDYKSMIEKHKEKKWLLIDDWDNKSVLFIL